MKVKIIPEMSQEYISKFWDRVDIKGEDDCWPWKLSLVDGYGQFSMNMESYRSNRISLFIKTGTQSEVARHTCDNRICCNPKHLEWGTVEDNVSDRIKRGRSRYVPQIGEQVHTAKLKAQDVIIIRNRLNQGVRRVDLAKEYGVSDSCIDNIATRQSWKHI